MPGCGGAIARIQVLQWRPVLHEEKLSVGVVPTEECVDRLTYLLEVQSNAFRDNLQVLHSVHICVHTVWTVCTAAVCVQNIITD